MDFLAAVAKRGEINMALGTTKQRAGMMRTKTEVGNSSWHREQQKQKVPGGGNVYLSGTKLQSNSATESKRGKV
jgi:hypothetical protein